MAIGIWAGVSAMALAIGPLVGGLLTEHVNWNWIFFVNVPIGVAGLIAIPIFIDESRDSSMEQRLDLPGLVASGVGLFALTFGVIEGHHFGWSSVWIVGAFVTAGVALLSFVLLERHQRVPMLDLALFRNRTFTGANSAMLFVGLAMFGTFFYVSLYVQNVLGYSPVQAGAMFLPMTVLIVVIAPIAGKFADKFGSRWLVGGGMALLAVMLLYYSTLDEHTTFYGLLPGLLIGGFGMSLTMTPTTAAAMSAVAADKAGIGSAVLNSSRQVGGSLGIAVMGAIVASGISTSLRAGDPYPIAYLHGFHDALRVGALLCIVGAVIAVAAIRKIEHKHVPQPAPVAEAA
jgi:EmrB/QacA subfamily drug resistance transporter